MGRDFIVKTVPGLYRISTHTPAWGATGVYGATGAKGENFNSHARVGRDRSYRCER